MRLPLLLAMGVALLGEGSGSARAELRLLAKDNGRIVVVTGIENNRIVGLDGEKKVVVPLGTTFAVDGDLEDNAAFVRWAPSYIIENDREPGAMLNMEHRPKSKSGTPPSPFLQAWPSGLTENGLALLGWMVDGKITQLGVTFAPATVDDRAFLLRQHFHLSPSELAGQGVMLLWMKGHFVSADPRLSNPPAENALVALLVGDLPKLQMALDAKTKPELSVREKNTLMHYAAEAGNLAAVDLLLSQGTDRRFEYEGYPLLYLPAANGRLAVVERLLEAGTNARGSVTSEPFLVVGRTPLHAAIAGGHSAVARLLVEKGASVNATDENHEYPFGLAIDAGDAELAELMIKHGADMNLTLDQKQGGLLTQLAAGHTAMARFLIQHKVDAHFIYRGRTPLSVAAIKGDPEAARLLLAAGAAVDEADAAGLSPLMVAASGGRTEFARVLVAAGAQVNRRAKDGRTPLHFAALRDTPEFCKLLLEHGADPKVLDQSGLAPLDFALFVGAREIARTLAVAGARIDLKSTHAVDSLESAVKLDESELLRAALGEGWSPDTRFHQSWPAILVARISGADGCVSVLNAAGAKLDGPDWPVIAPPAELDAKPRMVAAATPDDPRDVYADFPASSVLVDMVLDTEGRVQFPVVRQSPDLRLGISTLAAVRVWRFAPATRRGQPVCVRVQVPVEYPASPDRVLEVGQIETIPQVIRQDPPQYPADMAASGSEGRATVLFIIGRDGKVSDPRVLQYSDPAFGVPAILAVMKWTFKPGRVNGRPVATRVRQDIVFSLANR